MADVTYHAHDEIAIDEAIALYDSVGWSAYTAVPQHFSAMFAGASLVITARLAPDTNTDTENQTLVGLVRVVGDGATVAVVQDLLVRPDHHGRGIGGELLDRALHATRDVRQTYITTDAAPENQHVIDLYVRRGFAPSPHQGLCTLALLR